MEEPTAHAGNEELSILHPTGQGRLMMGNKLAPVLSSPQKEKVTSIFLIFFFLRSTFVCHPWKALGRHH